MGKPFFISLLIAMVGLAANAPAVENPLNPSSLTNGLEALGGSARAMALGSAYVAVPGDSSSVFWNPAGLAGLDSAQVALHHNSWLPGVFQETLVFALPVGDLGAFGLTASYLDFGSFDQRTASGDPSGNYSVNRWGLGLSWGRKIIPDLAFGAAVKATLENAASTQIGNLAADLGLTWTPLKGFTAGLALTNWGTYYQGAPTAEAARAGVSYRFNTDPSSQTLLAASYALQPYGVGRLEVGAEEVVHSFLALRAGYVGSLQDNQWGGLSSLTAGVGFRFSGLDLDYAYLPFGDLGTSHRVSLAYRFEASPKAKSPAPTTRLPANTTANTTVKTGPASTPLSVKSPISSPTQTLPTPLGAQVPTPTPAPKDNLELFFALPENQPVAEAASNTQTAADIQKYLARIRTNGNDSKAWLGLGIKYAQNRQFQRSVQCLEEALRLEPDNNLAKAWLKWVQNQSPQ